MKTLEQLAGWLLFSLSVLMVYGLLSLFLIGPVHARCYSNAGIEITTPGACDPPFAWIDSIFALPQPTFAQMEWEWRYSCNNPEAEVGCEEETTDANPPCNAEERAYDTEHRELLGLPPGECVVALPDYPTRAAGWLAAIEAQGQAAR